MMKLILASASPRRAMLLSQVGIPYQVIIPDFSEMITEDIAPDQLVLEFAMKKARSVSCRLRSGLVLAADTVVWHRGKILGKPDNEEDARRMLRLLSNECHKVLTGIALVDVAAEKYETGYSETSVWMKQLSEEIIDAYIATGEPMDKAGAYAIQGRAAIFIAKLEGCYFNIVGLPLGLLHDLLLKISLVSWYNWKDGDYAK
ncbi:MAG TPA: Maf family protein [Candidatus Limnocylindrales bacterium]|nr:Maf family protein [Candidatus Limnocylindrales bacterium]